MTSADDFWLNVVRLADSYADGGSTSAERSSIAMRQFDDMPRVAQVEVLKALRHLAYELPDLYAVAAARPQRADRPRETVPRPGLVPAL